MNFTSIQRDETCYHLSSVITRRSIFMANYTMYVADYWTWHKHLGHMSEQAFRQLMDNTKDFPCVKIPKSTPVCPSCAQGKMASKPFPDSQSRATANSELIHSDLKELPMISYHKYKYFIIFVDDQSGSMFTFNLRQKSNTFIAMKAFEAYVRIQEGKTIRRWCFDAGGEFKSTEVTTWLKSIGISIETMVPHQHQQNSRAKCSIRTIWDKAQTLHFTACLPPSWWEFCIDHAVHLINRTPVKQLKWKTPLEVCKSLVPDFKDYRVFGCGAYVYLPEKV